MIPQSFVQDLLNRVDIVDVVERHVSLRKAGANYVACCPFHGEKTPSFTVSPSKQFYHCFGCGAHGTAIGFLMEYSGLNFPEAVTELAARAGMQVPEERAAPMLARSAGLHEILLEATRYYREQLKRSDKAVAYLKSRGVSGEIAASFGMGYAPAGWQNLAAVFPDYQSKALVEAGLVIQGDDGKRYDRFRDRVMFPILNQRGQVIGFGGRVLDQGEPKYLNSPETPVFEKGRELYGLYQARPVVREGGTVLVVEGYMDVVALAQHEVRYAVATLGTATTPNQVQLLFRHGEKVVFCFDGDAAGRRAAWRALENCLAQLADGKQAAFLFLPEGEDPDTYVRKAGREGFERLLKGAQPLSTFFVSELAGRVDLTSPEGRARLLQEARPLVTRVVAPAIGLLVRKRLAELAGVSLQELNSLFHIKETLGAASRPPRRVEAPDHSLYRQMLRCIIFDPELARADELVVPPEAGRDGELLVQLVDFVRNCSPVVTTAALIQRFTETPWDRQLGELERELAPLGTEFNAEADFTGALRRLEQRRREEAREREREVLSAKGLDALTPEERSRYRELVQPVGQNPVRE
jgi:DNA primase